MTKTELIWNPLAKEKVRYVYRDRFDATSQILLRETPISKWICEQIEERKNIMNYQFISELNKNNQNATLCVGAAKVFVDVEEVTIDGPRMTFTCVNYDPLFLVNYDPRRTINPKCIGEKLIKKVIFNDPATIVFWDDGTKTVVKTQNGEAYDPEKGLAMAITKKALGNEGNYYNTFTKWLKESEEAEG